MQKSWKFFCWFLVWPHFDPNWWLEKFENQQGIAVNSNYVRYCRLLAYELRIIKMMIRQLSGCIYKMVAKSANLRYKRQHRIRGQI